MAIAISVDGIEGPNGHVIVNGGAPLNGKFAFSNVDAVNEKPTEGKLELSNGLKPIVLDAEKVLSEDTNNLRIVDNRTGMEYSIPIKNNAIDAVEFKKIRTADNTNVGLRLLDPGMQNTAVKESKITYVDGWKGEIQYRGNRVTDLVNNKRKFEEIIYLLVWEKLPTSQERTVFSMSLATYPIPPPSAFEVVKAFSPDSPPVMMMIAAFAAVNASRPQEIPTCRGENLYMGNMVAVDRQIIRAMSSLAATTCMVYCHKMRREFTPPDPSFSFVENMLLMMGHVDPKTKRPDPKTVNCLERLWVLTADHEMTNSTSTFLSVASSLNDLFTSLLASICASFGILHGGAIEMAYHQLQKVGSVEAVPELIKRVKAGKLRLFGYGHRVYKTVDPRFTEIQAMVQELASGATENSILPVAMEIDRIAREDEYFTSRKLKPNADFLASFVYTALGFPTDFILPLSIVARSAGALAHWREAMRAKAPSIWRPQQIYTGAMAPAN